MRFAYSVRAAVVLCALGLCMSAGRSQPAAQGSATDVAYVTDVKGRAVAASQGNAADLDVLDTIEDGTAVSLEANAELRICHYRTRKVLTLRGPLRATVSAAGVTADAGGPAVASGEPCAPPVVSTVQGGFAFRGLADVTKISLRPRIRIVNRAGQAIRKAVLRGGDHRTPVVMLGAAAAQPQLVDGQSYHLMVEFADGREWEMVLRASAAAEIDAVILVVR